MRPPFPSGKLEEVPLHEVLKLFGRVKHKSGVLVVRLEDGATGALVIRAGAIHHASIAEREGSPRACVLAMLGWSRGSFGLEVDDGRAYPTAPIGIDDVLAEGGFLEPR